MIGAASKPESIQMKLQRLQTKVDLLDVKNVEIFYRKLKLLNIECERAKEKRLISDSLELKVRRAAFGSLM